MLWGEPVKKLRDKADYIITQHKEKDFDEIERFEKEKELLDYLYDEIIYPSSYHRQEDYETACSLIQEALLYIRLYQIKKVFSGIYTISEWWRNNVTGFVCSIERPVELVFNPYPQDGQNLLSAPSFSDKMIIVWEKKSSLGSRIDLRHPIHSLFEESPKTYRIKEVIYETNFWFAEIEGKINIYPKFMHWDLLERFINDYIVKLFQPGFYRKVFMFSRLNAFLLREVAGMIFYLNHWPYTYYDSRFRNVAEMTKEFVVKSLEGYMYDGDYLNEI